jgi:hypothetical protein
MKAISVAAALLMVIGAPSWAQQDRDSQELAKYQLSESTLAKYSQAAHNLAALAKKLPSACNDDDDDDAGPSTIAKFVMKVEAIPGAKNAIESAGLTTHEFVVFTFTLVQSSGAAFALGKPGVQLPPGVSMANVNFVRTHQAAIEQLNADTDGQCNDDDDGGDSDGDR